MGKATQTPSGKAMRGPVTSWRGAISGRRRLLTLGGLAAVPVGECAPAASSGFCSGGL